MHPDEAALLAGIVAATADDLPRLVYADWLDEHGDADRAAYIRLRILGPDAALIRVHPNDALDRLAVMIPGAADRDARASPPPLGRYFTSEGDYARGMLHRVGVAEGQVEDFCRNFPALAAIAPIDQVDAGPGDGADLAALVRLPECRRLRCLSLDCHANPGPLVDALLDGRHLGGLERLEVVADESGPGLREYDSVLLLTTADEERLRRRFVALPSFRLNDYGSQHCRHPG